MTAKLTWRKDAAKRLRYPRWRLYADGKRALGFYYDHVGHGFYACSGGDHPGANARSPSDARGYVEGQWEAQRGHTVEDT